MIMNKVLVKAWPAYQISTRLQLEGGSSRLPGHLPGNRKVPGSMPGCEHHDASTVAAVVGEKAHPRTKRR